ncbi:MAG: Na/Pi symporter [Alicyclobacillus sp.]|nr:Na/Pi symporter [Alicyclobacillus sp.]
MWIHVAAVGLSLAAFLLSLRVMRTGLEGLGQARLAKLLQRFVRTPTRGILTGTAVTALLQSSAAVTAIAVGLVAAGTMTFRDAVGLVLGANVGSTVTPQLLTLDLWVFAVPLLVLGGVGLFSRRPGVRHAAMAMIGFASIFIALQALSAALEPLTELGQVAAVLRAAGSTPAVALLAGVLCSAAMQSSTATTVLAMALTSDGVIPLSGAIAIVIGANVGTCLTSVVAALGQSREAQQVALAHVLLNVGGAMAFLPALGPFANWMAALSADPGQQVANANTCFNLICTLALWPFTRPFADCVQRLLPNQRRT